MEYALLVRWGLVLTLLILLGAPISALVFSALPRRGAAFSLPLTLVILATVVFLVGQITFGVHTVVLGVLVVSGLSVAAYRAGGEPDWRGVGASCGVFFAGFLLFAVYISHNAAITPAGGEQFLHYGLTNTLASAESLPPEDFWFAGEKLRYYYGTQLQVAMLSMLTGTEVRYGYFLGLTTFYAVLFISAYGLVGTIVSSRGRSYHLGGTFGAFFVAIAGSSVTFLRQVFGRLPEDITTSYGEPVFRGLVAERGMSLQEAIISQGGDGDWLWFYERYVIEGGLYEFPLYSFIKADLHGHTLSTGYIVLGAAIAYSYYITPGEERLRRLGIIYGGLGLVAGVFGFMNTWSLPTAVGLAWLALAAAPSHPASLLPERLARPLSSVGDDDTSDLRQRVPAEAWRVLLAAVLAVPVGIIGVTIASPFLIFGHVPTNEGIGFLPPRSSLGPFLAMYSGILLLFTGYLAVKAPSISELSRIHLGVGGVLVAGLATLIWGSWAVSALLVVFLLVAWWLVRIERAGFTAVLLIAGLGLLLSLELVHAKVYPFDRVRWNTTLKVAVQGWTLAGLAAGGAAALLLSGGLERLRATIAELKGAETGGPGLSTLRSTGPAVLAIVLVVSVVATSLPFAAFAVYSNVGEDVLSPSEGTLDGLAVHEQYKGEEMEGLYWLDERGKSTIIEAPGRHSYQWKSVGSVFTDAVTVVGWDHQEGYRGEEAFDRRATAVEMLYVGPLEDAVDTLVRYDVEYIYVGTSEREAFAQINDFASVEGISVAFENEKVTIYEVDQNALQ
jgi:YYY domain-containing protein